MHCSIIVVLIDIAILMLWKYISVLLLSLATDFNIFAAALSLDYVDAYIGEIESALGGCNCAFWDHVVAI